MADAAVEFLLNNLKDLLVYHAKLITNTKTEIVALEKDLRLFHAFLKDSLKKRKKDKHTKELVRNMRDMVYEVEDVIDAFVINVMEKNSKSSFYKFWKTPIDLHNIGVKVEEVREKVKQAKVDFNSLQIDEEDKDGELKVRPPRVRNVVGFTDVTDKLIQRLTSDTVDMDVVSLTGMFGLGKSTVAWKVYNDSQVAYKLPVRIWVVVSQQFSRRRIFLSILKKLITITDEIHELDDDALARTVAEYLEGCSFLIVFDDVWSKADWNRLLDALPDRHTHAKGKILITSRQEDVGNFASNPRPATRLRSFNHDESWELLRFEALHKLECPPELETVGNLIASNCKGLPLACVILGGILASRYKESNMSATEREWKKVSAHVNMYLTETATDTDTDTIKRMNEFISLSYNRLPYHLRVCFLYLGVFPEDHEISASRLIKMWIGEGFIQKSYDLSLEEIGEMYLDDLINRNLVTADKLKPNGKVKTCRIHDTLRDFCQKEAGNNNENVFQEIKLVEGKFEPLLSDIDSTVRRISIHSNCSDFIKSKPQGHRVRSFLCFSKEEFTLDVENIPDLLSAFKLLRVLDFMPTKLIKLSPQMYQLVHARYVAIAMASKLLILPAKFNQMWNIQTLIVNTAGRTLDVKADLWKLSHLRHFKTNASATLLKPGKESKYGAELQTLGLISAESCTPELLERACNLKKLGIRGKLALLLEGKAGSFENVGMMKSLEKLKLVNDVHPEPTSKGKLHRLPEPYQFPSNLKSLTLDSTFLDWSFMSNLGLLGNLEALKLKRNAFAGPTWKAVDGGFRRLEFLLIEDTDLSFWEAKAHHFPRLRALELKNCEKLVGIPLQLAEMKTFQMLELYRCTLANESAKEIRDAKGKTQTEGSTFKLSIFPPIE